MSATILQFPMRPRPPARDVAPCPRTLALIDPGVPVAGIGHVFSFSDPKHCALCGLIVP